MATSHNTRWGDGDAGQAAAPATPAPPRAPASGGHGASRSGGPPAGLVRPLAQAGRRGPPLRDEPGFAPLSLPQSRAAGAACCHAHPADERLATRHRVAPAAERTSRVLVHGTPLSTYALALEAPVARGAARVSDSRRFVARCDRLAHDSTMPRWFPRGRSHLTNAVAMPMPASSGTLRPARMATSRPCRRGGHHASIPASGGRGSVDRG